MIRINRLGLSAGLVHNPVGAKSCRIVKKSINVSGINCVAIGEGFCLEHGSGSLWICVTMPAVKLGAKQENLAKQGIEKS